MQAGSILPRPSAPQTTPSTAQTSHLGPAPTFKHQHGQQALRRQLDRRSSILRGLCWRQDGRRLAGAPAKVFRSCVGCSRHGGGCAGVGSAGSSGKDTPCGWAVASTGKGGDSYAQQLWWQLRQLKRITAVQAGRHV